MLKSASPRNITLGIRVLISLEKQEYIHSMTISQIQLLEQAGKLLETCRAHGVMVTTAESCTGGLIAGTLTEIAGSSDVVERGFVTYSNESKNELLGVPSQLIATEGAVSEPVALAMAKGALKRSNADISVSVTGIAGPGGGSAEKPVGLVHIAATNKTGIIIHRKCLFGDKSRKEIRMLTIAAAFDLIEELLKTP